MRIARDEKLLKRRVDDYLWRDQSKTVQALRHALNEHFSDFKNVSIFGGMIRDLARGGKSAFNSDVDLVIDAPAYEVHKLAIRLSAKSNSFGGYGFSTERWKIDFWALETTWSLRQGYVRATSIDELLQGTFFDWDAVHYDINERRIYAQEGYLQKLKSRTLGVNVLETPSAVGNAVRAIRRVISWDVRVTATLFSFIEVVVRDNGIEALVEFEKKKYGNSICSGFETTGKLINAIALLNERTDISLSSPRQLELPLDIFAA